MYVDMTAVEVEDSSLASEIARSIRRALHPLERHLRRIQVEMRTDSGRHVCRLCAWAERGHTVVIESCATSREEALWPPTA